MSTFMLWYTYVFLGLLFLGLGLLPYSIFFFEKLF